MEVGIVIDKIIAELCFIKGTHVHPIKLRMCAVLQPRRGFCKKKRVLAAVIRTFQKLRILLSIIIIVNPTICTIAIELRQSTHANNTNTAMKKYFSDTRVKIES